VGPPNYRHDDLQRGGHQKNTECPKKSGRKSQGNQHWEEQPWQQEGAYGEHKKRYEKAETKQKRGAKKRRSSRGRLTVSNSQGMGHGLNGKKKEKSQCRNNQDKGGKSNGKTKIEVGQNRYTEDHARNTGKKRLCKTKHGRQYKHGQGKTTALYRVEKETHRYTCRN